MTISEVSQKCDITPSTLRYYERLGLIPPVARNASGFREYDEETIETIEMLKWMRSAGMEIEALVEYIGLCRQEGDTLQRRKEILVTQRGRLIRRAEELRESLEKLDHKIAWYESLCDKEQV